MDETNRSGLIDFYHDQLRTAVFHRYLRMASPSSAQSVECRAAHQELAVYFTAVAADSPGEHRRWRADRPHSLAELPYHLVQADLQSQARALLLDFEWLQTKLQALGPAAVLADFAMFDDDPVLRSVEGTLRRMAVTLEKDDTQLAGQLLARLSSYPAPEIRTLLAQAAQWNGGAWLRPLTASLAPPDAPRTERFIGVQAVAISPDLRQALTCSDEGIVKVWSFETNTEVRTLGHYSQVRSASAATPYGHRAISGTADGSMTVWAPFDRTEPVCVLRGHTAPITAIAITPDGRYALSASEDQSLKLWDVERGTEVPRLAREVLSANRLAITPDGRRGLSSFGGSIRFGTSRTGQSCVPRSSTGSRSRRWPYPSTAPARCLRAVTPCTCFGYRTGNRQRTQRARGHHPHACVDRRWRCRVGIGLNVRLRVWDGVAAPRSACLQGALVVGDVRRCHARRTLRDLRRRRRNDQDLGFARVRERARREEGAHRAQYRRINSVVVTPDGTVTVPAASRDTSIKVWDSASGLLVRTLAGHTGWVSAVAITPDGARAVTGADDSRPRVWDLCDGTTLKKRTLRGLPSASPVLPSLQMDGVWHRAAGIQRCKSGISKRMPRSTICQDTRTAAEGPGFAPWPSRRMALAWLLRHRTIPSRCGI